MAPDYSPAVAPGLPMGSNTYMELDKACEQCDHHTFVCPLHQRLCCTVTVLMHSTRSSCKSMTQTVVLAEQERYVHMDSRIDEVKGQGHCDLTKHDFGL